ncbi:hypothetical protein MKW94_010963 [Papaver nudicaule]|uniref:COMM domain-containing protein n=1 Tax=Papaver nudicaule TaxID=74823 RepID=A0AA41SCJ8_PAPNU|nr:hypothetical protein [Papaver nudicaule]
MEQNRRTSDLFLQMHKLPSSASEQTLAHILETLWRTRKTGLRPVDKSSIRSLLCLPSLEELDPLLACLRSLIRKSVHENLIPDDMLKLFPIDLSLHLQTTLVLLLQRYQNQWKEDTSVDSQRAGALYQANAVGTPPSVTPYSAAAAEILSPLWPRQDDVPVCFSHSDIVSCAPLACDTSMANVASVPPRQHVISTKDMGVLPCLKSMTWTMERRSSAPANRVAVVSLKLQDRNKSASGETEVKFQITKDTVDATLRSMTYISEQLENIAAGHIPSEPLQKKQRQ